MSKMQELKNISKDISIIYTEDEDKLRDGVSLYLKKFFDDVRVFSNGEDGLNAYKERHADIVITDIQMPRLNGIEMLKEIKKISPTQEMVVTSAYTEKDYFTESINIGVSAYIIKPIDNDRIVETLYKIVTKIKIFRENEEYHNRLEELVELKAKESLELEKEKIENYEQTLMALVKMVEERDSYTAGHSQRVAQYSKMIAKEMGYSDEECEIIYRAGILHDIGKVVTPDAILLKPGSLNTIEHRLIQEHVNTAKNFLGDISMFKDIVKIIESHHERYDGKGYPKGLKGDEINKMSQIMIVADAFDAMTTSRIYKGRKSVDEAIDELKALSCEQFHPNVVDRAVEILSTIELDNNISQFPITEIELERFKYFYSDKLTELYNQDYLDVMLMKNRYNYKFKNIELTYLHNFTKYNDENGWDEGDKILKKVANFLKEQVEESMLFRIHGDDFAILHLDDNSCLDVEKLNEIDFLKESKLSVSSHCLEIIPNELTTLYIIENRLTKNSSDSGERS